LIGRMHTIRSGIDLISLHDLVSISYHKSDLVPTIRSHVTEGAGVHITCRTLDLTPSKICP
jgi:hypothetical protein